MTLTMAQVVGQFKQNWVRQLEDEQIAAVCREVGYTWRSGVLDPMRTLRVFLLQIVHGNTACEHVRHLARLSFTASAYCQARSRLPLRVLELLLRGVSRKLQGTSLDQGRWRGHRTFLVDGSSFSMPDMPALQAHFGQPPAQRAGCGFPTAHLLLLFHAESGLLLEVLAGPWRRHDLSGATKLHPALHAGDVLVGDRGFCSYAHLALLSQQEVHGVFRIHQKQIVDFRPQRPHAGPGRRKKCDQGLPRSRWIQQLGVEDQVVEWFKPLECPAWMTQREYAALPDRLRVRELRYRVEDPAARVHEITLVTTLVDAERYPLEALAELYHTRWSVETNLAHLKRTLGLDVLKCKTVNGVLKEVLAFALVYNLVRQVMLAAAHRQGVPVARISFVDALRWLALAVDGRPLCPLVINPVRPGRHEPRVRKRRPKNFPLMRKPRDQLRRTLGKQKACAFAS